MTANIHDHGRRLYDLEVALVALVQASTEMGDAGTVREAARRARSIGAKGAAELLEGQRVAAAYRR